MFMTNKNTVLPTNTSIVDQYFGGEKVKISLGSGVIAGGASMLLGNNSFIPYALVGAGSTFVAENFSENFDNFIKTHTPIQDTHNLTKPLTTVFCGLGSGYILSGFEFPSAITALALTGVFAGSHWIASKLF